MIAANVKIPRILPYKQSVRKAGRDFDEVEIKEFFITLFWICSSNNKQRFSLLERHCTNIGYTYIVKSIAKRAGDDIIYGGREAIAAGRARTDTGVGT